MRSGPSGARAVGVSMTVAATIVVAMLLTACAADDSSGTGIDRHAEITEFVNANAEAWATADIDHLVGTLHPVTFDHWTEADCQRSIGEVAPLTVFRAVTAITFVGEMSFDYGSGRSSRFTGAYRVFFDTNDGQNLRMHVAYVSDELHWFTNCDSLADLADVGSTESPASET